MATTTVAASTGSSPEPPDGVIDLRGHRLGDLVQVLSGCTAERAELAVAAHRHGTPVAPDVALDTIARALVRLRCPPAPRREPAD
jgi:hypothetical protein